MELNIAAVILLSFIGVVITIRAGSRTAQDVVCDLGDNSFQADQEGVLLTGKRGKERFILGDELAEAGLFYQDERSAFRRQQSLLPLYAAGLMVLVKEVLFGGTVPGLCRVCLARRFRKASEQGLRLAARGVFASLCRDGARRSGLQLLQI